MWAVVGYIGDQVGRRVEGSEERRRARDEGMCPRLWFPFEALAIRCVYLACMNVHCKILHAPLNIVKNNCYIRECVYLCVCPVGRNRS